MWMRLITTFVPLLTMAPVSSKRVSFLLFKELIVAGVSPVDPSECSTECICDGGGLVRE